MQNSNVVRFFSALIKDQPEKQVVYYQVSAFRFNPLKFQLHAIID